jgi:nucleotide-binding universal stress UspA family protein
MAGTILVAVDFEDPSRRALALAKELAPDLEADLCLCHVYELPLYTYPGIEPQILPDFRREVTLAAGRALAQLAEEHGITRTALREGDTAREIVAAAREEGATLIAMGTSGRTGIAHAVLGSVAEKVIRESEIPVLTVRGVTMGPRAAPNPGPALPAHPGGKRP